MGVIVVIDKKDIDKVANVFAVKLDPALKISAQQVIGSTMAIGRRQEQGTMKSRLAMGKRQRTTLSGHKGTVLRLGTKWDSTAGTWVSVNRISKDKGNFKMAYLHWNKPTDGEVSGYYTSVLANLWSKPVTYKKNSPWVGQSGHETRWKAGTIRPAKSDVWSVAQSAIPNAVPQGVVKAEAVLQKLIDKADET